MFPDSRLPSSAICFVFRFSGARRKYGITVFWKSMSTTFMSITLVSTPYRRTHLKLHQISLFFFSGNHRSSNYLGSFCVPILFHFWFLQSWSGFWQLFLQFLHERANQWLESTIKSSHCLISFTIYFALHEYSKKSEIWRTDFLKRPLIGWELLVAFRHGAREHSHFGGR